MTNLNAAELLPAPPLAPIGDKANPIELVLRKQDYEAIDDLAALSGIKIPEFLDRAIACYEYLWNTNHEGKIIFVRSGHGTLELDIEDPCELVPQLSPKSNAKSSALEREGAVSAVPVGPVPVSDSETEEKVLTTLVIKTQNMEKIVRKAERLNVPVKHFLTEAIRTYYFVRTCVPADENREISLYIGTSPETGYRYIVP